MTRRERRQQRHRRLATRAVAAGVVTAVLGTVAALGGIAAASDEPQRPQGLHRAPVAIEPLWWRQATRCRSGPHSATRLRPSPPSGSLEHRISHEETRGRSIHIEMLRPLD